VYFTTTTGLFTCPKTGCASPTLLLQSAFYSAVLYEPTFNVLYVADYSNGGRVDEETVLGAPTFVQNLSSPGGFAIEGNHVFASFDTGIAEGPAGCRGTPARSSARSVRDPS
jgi:hypothetical protein